VPEAHTLDVEHLVVRYYGRDDDALRDVSLGVRPGELVSVAGANGAGKSTLALAAAGLIPRIVRAQVSGRVSIDGELAIDQRTHGGATGDHRPASRRHGYRAGIVFPNPANQLSGTKTSVREEIGFGLENLGVPREQMDARIDRVLQDLDIAHLADRPPYAVSGGEQQRVAIASIIAMGLPLLVLDEPTAQLDPLATRNVADHLVHLARGGVAVLVAEHAPAVLARTQRTAVLHDGRIATVAAPGRALQPEALAGTGLESPTLVALAAAAGVAPDGAFDEAAIAAALRHPGALRTPASPTAEGANLAIRAWESVREAAPAAIEIRDLVHRYPTGVEALRGVSLHIPTGQAVAIVGQNGSGKTTLVKHLDGLLKATSGDVRVGGASVAGVPVHRMAATVGFVFQNPDDQLFSRSVERELHFGPRNLRLPKADADRLVEASLAAIGLTADRAANPYDLNVSARKLIALGSVLATDPAILVLDEPTTGQDAPGIARVGAIVEALRAAGRTVIAITHDMEFAARHFERVVVMRHGEIVADGPPDETLSASAADLLATTGLTPPPAARVAGLLGIAGAPAGARELLALLPA
jgi:energy-coupling factor transport system ATP-binding protein